MAFSWPAEACARLRLRRWRRGRFPEFAARRARRDSRMMRCRNTACARCFTSSSQWRDETVRASRRARAHIPPTPARRGANCHSGRTCATAREPLSVPAGSPSPTGSHTPARLGSYQDFAAHQERTSRITSRSITAVGRDFFFALDGALPQCESVPLARDTLPGSSCCEPVKLGLGRRMRAFHLDRILPSPSRGTAVPVHECSYRWLQCDFLRHCLQAAPTAS